MTDEDAMIRMVAPIATLVAIAIGALSKETMLPARSIEPAVRNLETIAKLFEASGHDEQAGAIWAVARALEHNPPSPRPNNP